MPTLRLKGEKALGERGPWELFGGAPRRCGSAPRRRGSASVVQRPRGSRGSRKSRNSSARARDWRGGWFAGCLVGGRWGEGGGGGEMVLGSGGEGRMVFAGDGFAFCFCLVFLSVYIQKKTVCLFHCLKSKL